MATINTTDLLNAKEIAARFAVSKTMKLDLGEN